LNHLAASDFLALLCHPPLEVQKYRTL